MGDLDPRELAHLCTIDGSVDVRAFTPQHGANNYYCDRGFNSAADTASCGPGTTAAATVPHGHISRTVRTAAAAISGEPNPGAVAASYTGVGSRAARPGTQGLAAVATEPVSASVQGHPATTTRAPAEDTGSSQRRAVATRCPATAAAAAATDAAGPGSPATRAVPEVAKRRRCVQDGQR